ncbi:MAG: polyprenyl synthetase family protein [Candidatus Hodarchaeota archaeon]
MDFLKALLEEVETINKTIKEFFNGRDYVKDDPFVAEYYKILEEYILAGGKRLRPFLLLQGYKGLAIDPSDAIYRPSLSVEFLHNASLIHDDIIDNDEMRRGNPAFHAIFKKMKDNSHFGLTLGILGGDSTFFLGMESLYGSFPAQVTLEAMNLYVKAFHEICEGVLMEMNFVHVPEVTEKQYMKMISLKTAALIEKSLLIGATFASASNEHKQALSKYAIDLGNAFQIKDDLLGSFGDAKVTGKPTDGDIKEGKKTLLLIKSQEKASDKQKKILEQFLGIPTITNEEVDEVRSVFKSSGAAIYCEEKIQEFSNEAMAAIDELDGIMKQDQQLVLKGLVTFNLGRKK